MKNLKLMHTKWLVLLLFLPLMTSCWEDLPSYEGTKITKVGFYHRFAGPNKDQITGEAIAVEKELSCKYDINEESAVVNVTVTVPQANGDFTEAERAKVSQSNLWGYANLETAARIFPIEGSAKLGTPDDWTKEHKFRVEAANGNSKIWTIKIVEFNR